MPKRRRPRQHRRKRRRSRRRYLSRRRRRRRRSRRSSRSLPRPAVGVLQRTSPHVRSHRPLVGTATRRVARQKRSRFPRRCRRRVSPKSLARESRRAMRQAIGTAMRRVIRRWQRRLPRKRWKAAPLKSRATGHRRATRTLVGTAMKRLERRRLRRRPRSTSPSRWLAGSFRKRHRSRFHRSPLVGTAKAMRTRRQRPSLSPWPRPSLSPWQRLRLSQWQSPRLSPQRSQSAKRIPASWSSWRALKKRCQSTLLRGSLRSDPLQRRANVTSLRSPASRHQTMRPVRHCRQSAAPSWAC
mmetsp:Transcript_50262/g.107681  ORF Transcript_50262/g.107681 Transcript_50262/m.107681 type:complete len:298 (-) Transcript_50262:923-1816(-)